MTLPLRGHAHPAGDELLGVEEVDVEKTTNGILSRRELHLSKEALLERHACHLTKRFMKMSEEYQQEKLKAEAAQSHMQHEQINQKAQQASESQDLLDNMVREQRQQIQAMIREKAHKREAEERQARDERLEREKWVQARKIHDEMEYERRRAAREDTAEEVREKLKEKSLKHEEAVKVLDEEKKTALQMRIEREEKKAEEAEKRRRQRAVQARAQTSNRTEKREQADQRRQQLAEEAMKSAREAKERREQKVRELKQRADHELEERNKRFIGKLMDDRRPEGSLQGDSTRSRQAEKPPNQEEPGRQGDRERQGDRPAGEDDGSKSPREAKGVPNPSIYYYCTPRVGKELIDANVRVQKEYVRRCHDLEKDKHDMLTHKQFKSLAETAKTLGDKFEGGYTRKMRSLHRMYINPKTREDKSPAASASPRGGASSSTASAQPTPRKPLSLKLKPCGLCDREYPVESLEGSALRRTVEKFRQQMPCLPRDGRWAEGRGAFGPSNDNMKKVHSMSEGDGLTTSQNSKSERPGESLYDYEVRLCTACWNFIRIACI